MLTAKAQPRKIAFRGCFLCIIVLVIILPIFPLYPSHKKPHYPLLFICGKLPSLGHTIPLFKAPPAAAGAGVLSDKNRVSPHRGLLPVIWYHRRSKAARHKIGAVPPYGLHTFFINIANVFGRKVKPRPKRRFFQLLQCFINRLHHLFLET